MKMASDSSSSSLSCASSSFEPGETLVDSNTGDKTNHRRRCTRTTLCVFGILCVLLVGSLVIVAAMYYGSEKPDTDVATSQPRRDCLEPKEVSVDEPPSGNANMTAITLLFGDCLVPQHVADNETQWAEAISTVACVIGANEMEEQCLAMGYQWRPFDWSWTNASGMFAGYRDLPCTLTATTTSGNCVMPTQEAVEDVVDDIFWMLQCEYGTTAWGGRLPKWLSDCEYFGYELLYDDHQGPLITKTIEIWDNSTEVQANNAQSLSDGGVYYHCKVTRPQNWIGWEEVTWELQHGDPITFYLDQILAGKTKCEYLGFQVDWEVSPPHP